MLGYASSIDIVQDVQDMQYTVGQHRMVSFCINSGCGDKVLKHLVIHTTCIAKCQPKVILCIPVQWVMCNLYLVYQAVLKTGKINIAI